MIFKATALNYAYRVYFQLSLVAMIDKNVTVYNETSKEYDVVELPDVSTTYLNFAPTPHELNTHLISS